MENLNGKRIKVLKNGPYEVTGNVPLNELEYVSNSKGFSLSYHQTKEYPSSDKYYLCRCGKSMNKPFCDGSHLKGFDGTETAGHKTYEEIATFIEGKNINLMDAEELCAGARFCDVKSGAWNLATKSDYPDSAEVVKEQCAHCPSGRLTAVTKDGVIIEPELPQEISILDDPATYSVGPIWVKGRIPIEDAEHKPYVVRNRVTLCRCGRSENKPYCDGSHMEK